MDCTERQSPRDEHTPARRPIGSLPLHVWADEIRAIVNEQLRWGDPDEYAQRRCDRLLRIAAEMASAHDVRDADSIEDLYRGDLHHLSPYCGGDAAIFDADGRILLIQRTDNHLWATPGGAIEVGESPAEGVAREAWEESGLEVDVLSLVGVYDSRLIGTRLPFHLFHFVFLCRPRDPTATPRRTNETLDVRWFAEDDLPPLSPGHERRIVDSFARLRGDLTDAVFNPIEPT